MDAGDVVQQFPLPLVPFPLVNTAMHHTQRVTEMVIYRRLMSLALVVVCVLTWRHRLLYTPKSIRNGTCYYMYMYVIIYPPTPANANNPRRDLKPTNIGLCAEGHVKLFDLGLSVVQEVREGNIDQKYQVRVDLLSSTFSACFH